MRDRLTHYLRQQELPVAFSVGDVLTMDGFMRGVRVLDEVGHFDRQGWQEGGFQDVPIFPVSLYLGWRISPRILKVERGGKVIYTKDGAGEGRG